MTIRCRESFSGRLAVATFLLAVVRISLAGEPDQATDSLRAGRNFLATPVYTAEQDEEILRLFEGLRVADVSDGMESEEPS